MMNKQKYQQGLNSILMGSNAESLCVPEEPTTSSSRLVVVVKGKGTVKPLMEVFDDTATECHLPYGITQVKVKA